MFRLTPLCGRDRGSPPGDLNISQRSSTEDHEDEKSRDMSVADHHTPDQVSGRESPVWLEYMAADLSIQNYNTQTSNEIFGRSTSISPRKLSSKVYMPTPYRKPLIPAYEIEPVKITKTASELEIASDIPSVEHAPVIAPMYFSPTPYSKRSRPFSPVSWQSPVSAGVDSSNDGLDTTPGPIETCADEKAITPHTSCLDGNVTKQPITLGDLAATGRSQMPSDVCVLNTSVLSLSATIPKTSPNKGQLSVDTISEVTDTESMSEKRRECIESLSPEADIRMRDDVKIKENRRKEQLINMKSFQEPPSSRRWNKTTKNSDRTSTSTEDQAKRNKSAKTERTNRSSVKEKPPSEDYEKMEQLKSVFQEHLKEKERFEKLIERREQDIEEQIREMDEVLESINTEQSEVEEVAGEFADIMKTYTNFRDEATRLRVQNVEYEISSDILFAENEEIKEKVRELYDQINEIKERRSVGLDGLKKATEEMECETDVLREENEENEAAIKLKVEEFNRLRMVMMDEEITYVTNRKPVQESDWDTFPRAGISLSPQLKTAGTDNCTLEIDIFDMDTVSPDILTPRLMRSLESDKIKRMRYGYDKPVRLTQQMSATEQVRPPEDQKRKSRIPKPVVQTYGSARRDEDRLTVSKSSSMLDELVPERRRHVTKSTMGFRDAEIETRRLKKRVGSLIADRENGLRNQKDILEYDRKGLGQELHHDNEGSNIYFEEKRTRSKRKEVKSKIDTGLKNLPKNMAISKVVPAHSVAITGMSKNKQGRKNEPSKTTGKRKSYVKPKECELPPLKNNPKTTKNVNDMPVSSRSFGDKTPLPEIKPVSHQKMNKRQQLPPIEVKSKTGPVSSAKVSNKRNDKSRPRRVSAPLPPISKVGSKKQNMSMAVKGTSKRSKGNTRRIPPIVSAQDQATQTVSKTRTPEAVWISLSPSPPSSRNSKQRDRMETSPDQGDKKRVMYGRA